MPLLAATVTPTFHRAGAGIRRAAPRRAVRAVAFVGEGNGVKLQPPVIDAEEFLRKERTLFLPSNAVARSIADAGAEFGCFQLVNHGVSPQLLSDLQRVSRAFFDLPAERKAQVRRTKENPNGWAPDELTKQIVDIKEIFDYCHEIENIIPGFTQPNQWPAGEPEFKDVLTRYLEEMTRVSFKLLEAFALGLGLPANTLNPLFEDAHTSFMRLNWYPATPADESGLGLNEHTDAGFHTILIQDEKVHGLEFYKDGAWHSVTPAPGALTINVGDQAQVGPREALELQVLTNDIFKAPLHRVRSPHNVARLSTPFFFNPRPDAVIEPLSQFVTPERPAAYRPIPWRSFREQRFAGDYANLGEEIQIYHFRQ